MLLGVVRPTDRLPLTPSYRKTVRHVRAWTSPTSHSSLALAVPRSARFVGVDGHSARSPRRCFSGPNASNMAARVRDHYRAHARRKVNLLAGLYLPVIDGRRGIQVRIRDLGLGGAGLEVLDSSVALRPDTNATLEVTAPSLWDPLVLRGRVAWARPSRDPQSTKLGLRFEHTEHGGLYALFQLLGAQTFDG